MKKIITIFILFTFLNTIITSANNNLKTEDIILKADELFKQSDYVEALQLYLNALDLINKEKNKNDIKIANLKNIIGLCYYYIANYKNAIDYYKEAMILYEKTNQKDNYYTVIINMTYAYWYLTDYDNYILYSAKLSDYYRGVKNHEGIVASYLNIAIAYYYKNDFDNSFLFYEKALPFIDKVSNDFYKMHIYSGLANMHFIFSNYSPAFKYYQEAYNLSLSMKDKNIEITCLFGLGDILFIWGNYDKSLNYYEKANKISLETNSIENQIKLNDKTARIYQAKNDFEKAILYFEKSIKAAQSIKKTDDEAAGLNSLGAAYFEWQKFDQAITYYNQALTLAEKNNLFYQLNRIYIHIGGYYHFQNDFNKAYEFYIKGLEYTRTINNKMDEIVCLGNLGGLFFNKADYEKSSYYLNQSIDIIENVRMTAKGELRRDFLATQIKYYKSLVSAYFYNNKIDYAFDTIEKARAKYLIDQMSSKLNVNEFKFSGINNYKNKLKDNEIIINYSNIDWVDFFIFTCDKNNLNCIKNNYHDFTEEIYKTYNKSINNNYNNLRGLKKASANPDYSSYTVSETKIDENDAVRFEMIINYYRYLLSNPDKTANEINEMKIISKKLFGILINPVYEKIKDKKELIIIPDGILSFLPFESLIMPDGRYLIEAFDIKYKQSLTVDELIEKRSYSKDRKPIIAFGGAKYEDINNSPIQTLNNIYDMNMLYSEILNLIEKKLNLRDSYEKLGITGWQNLPGTFKEAESIGKIIKDADIITDLSVSEEIIKNLSINKKLVNYKIIHFATHGLVVPEMPELSALVLSQLKDTKNEDGYLTLNEISLLDINADFVNLSACETGLGKIYGGEGVVGLTQSFLIAGANGLSVSLWQVADQSTMEFMTGFYSLIVEKKLNYNQAINEMKKKFISENKFKDPFYWACFIYCGK